MSGLSGVKQCDAMIKAALSGQSVNLNDLPELPARGSGIQEDAMQVKRNKFWKALTFDFFLCKISL